MKPNPAAHEAPQDLDLLTCRFCRSPLEHTFANLGVSPLANAFLRAEDLQRPEMFLPLHARVCSQCFLVQVPEIESPKKIFTNYPYFSSVSESWLAHARDFAAMACERFQLNENKRVVEVASNDGYLLRFFAERQVPVLGIEPARNVAATAQAAGIETLVAFFGSELAKKLVADGQQGDLVVGNNVLAHTPHLNDFVRGLKILLAPEGVISLEFPHLQRLIEGNQFDTIYHEHFSYFSLTTVQQVLNAEGLRLFDVEELTTHGGSLRLLACHDQDARDTLPAVADLLETERAAGLTTLDPYLAFGERVKSTKRELLSFLIEAKQQGRQVVGYGAPAKGNTFLNYCGIRSDFLDYTVDKSPAKQGKFLPGTHIPISAPEHLAATRPDDVLILPWNLKDEIVEQMAHIRDWGGRFVVAIPKVGFVP